MAVLGVVATVVGLRSRPGADDPVVLSSRARTLLDQVIVSEGRTLQLLLCDVGDPQPADVGFAQPDAALLRWRTDGGDHRGSLSTIADFYGGLDRGRLVVLGEPGAGKTVLVIQLLLDLAAEQYAVSGSEAFSSGAGNYVPVRLSLSAFSGIPEDSTPDMVREWLDNWLADHLIRVYGVKLAVAEALIRHGWILPVLDGLDEMDPDDGEPRRGRAIVAALNIPSGPTRWKVVLTCRSARYDLLGNGSTTGTLQDATVVVMLPLEVEQVVAWLAHRCPDPSQPDGLQRRWRRITTRVRENPAGRLARCLTNPLRLYLAITAYQSMDSEPRELCDLDALALEDLLLDRLVPASTVSHTGAHGDRYDPADVDRWLRTFANHLTWMARAGNSAIDLHPHELWRSTGSRRHPGRRIFLASAVLLAVAGPAFAALGVLGSWVVNRRLAITDELVALSVLCALAGAAGGLASMNTYPRRVDLNVLRTAAGRRRLTNRFLNLAGFLASALLVGGLTLGVLEGFFRVLVVALLIIGMGSSVILLVDALTIRPEAIAKPSDAVRQGIAYNLAVMIAVVLTICGLAIPAYFSISSDPTQTVEMVNYVFNVLVIAVTIGLAVGFARSPWPRYLVTVRHHVRAGALPARPAKFLDWAYTAGLVRLSGTAVQFRHRTLQDRLSATTTR